MIFEVSMASHKASVPTAYNNYELESVRKYLETEEIPTVLHRRRWWVNGFRTSSYIEKLCTLHFNLELSNLQSQTYTSVN